MKRFARPHVPEEELHAYADNQVSGGQRAEIAEHMMGCLICRAQYAEVRDLRVRTSEILAFAVPRIPAALQATEPTAAKSPRDVSKGRRSALMAAAVAMTVVGTWMIQRDDTKTAARAALATVFVAPALYASTGDAVGATPPDPSPALPAAAWEAVSWEDAVRITDGALARLEGYPITAVRVERTAVGVRPTVLVRQQLPDGRDAWVVDGPAKRIADVAGVLAATGLKLSPPATLGIRGIQVAASIDADSIASLAGRLRFN